MIMADTTNTQQDAINCAPPKNIGLRGIVVADSNICKVEGKAGKLNYRGFDVLTLADNSTFEEVIHLLLYDVLPTDGQLSALKKELAEYRYLPSFLVDFLKQLPASTTPMEVLQSAVAVMGASDPDISDESKEANLRKAMRLIARLPLVTTAWDRIRNGKEAVEASPDLDHAANLLFTLHNKIPDPETARDMDLCLILHAEHSFNASTFTARQIASTRANMYAAISGAIGSLSGELHGGANARVFEMLQNIGNVENVRPYVTKSLDEGGRIMGMGHAVYSTLDPRAKVLGPMSKRLSEKTGDSKFYDISEEVLEVTREEFKSRKGVDINANVDFFSASVYHMMGFKKDLFTPLFAISRVSGWATHVIEEKFAEAQPKPALYRPRAEYSGRYCGPEGCDWVPVNQRKK